MFSFYFSFIMCSNKHAYTTQNFQAFLLQSLSSPLLNLTTCRLPFMLTQGVNDGLETTLIPKTAQLGVGIGMKGRREKLREIGGWGREEPLMGGWVCPEISDPERGAESPGTLKDRVFKKEELVTFQVISCFSPPYYEKQSIGPTPFLAVYQSL